MDNESNFYLQQLNLKIRIFLTQTPLKEFNNSVKKEKKNELNKLKQQFEVFVGFIYNIW
jgi:hypothetical protein